MSYFKLLSGDPADYENEENHDSESFNTDIEELHDCLELTFDTGEQFCIPLEWLLCACRENKFNETSHSGLLH